jgi:hypothetical protein
MSKGKRSNLAIFTLAGSILISSVIVSMSQVNAHSTSATKREFLALKQCISGFQKDTAKFYEWYLIKDDNYPNREEIPSQYKPYVFDSDGRQMGEENILLWMADGLEC